ncbi:MAG TPA: phosphatase PAP2 family protein [Burkholderiales bacterium]|nr:phosphatase PAP2 family protein [Burkholderiales bacterium]
MQRVEAASVALAPRIPFWWFAAPIALAMALIALDQMSDADRTITRLFVDADTRAFPLRYSFVLEIVMHQWAKYVVITIGALVGAAVVLTYVVPPWQPRRRILVFLLLSMALAPLSVTAGKAVSSPHCPWDIDEFGGLVPYAHLLEPRVTRVVPGHCFPAGHASTGFALMAFYFAAYVLGRREWAWYALVFSVGAGLLLGFGRVLQGAHFVSHVLWSGVFCWTVMLLLYVMAFVSPGRSHRKNACTPRSAPQDIS